MVSRRVLPALVLVLSLVVVAGGPVAARPPPAPVCDVCTDQLAAAAADHGVDIRPGESRLSIQVFANGSARWTAQVDLTGSSGAETDDRDTTVRRPRIDVSATAAVESLRTDDALRNAIVADAQEWDVLATRANVTSRVSDGTLIVTYWRPGAIERSGDTLVFTAFHAENPNRDAPLYGGADEVVLRAPDDYRITSGPAGDTATANETVAVWASETTGRSGDWEGPSIDYTSVKFAPTDNSGANAPLDGQTGGVMAAIPTPLLVVSGIAAFFGGLALLQYAFHVVFVPSNGRSDRKA